MSKKVFVHSIWQDFLDQISQFYPYFIIFYLVSFGISIFFINWKNYFYWPAFHFSTLVFTLLFFVDLLLYKRMTEKRTYAVFSLVSILKYWLVKQIDIIRHIKWTRVIIFKLLFVVGVLIFSLVKSIGLVDFLILWYALVSVLFMLESRVAAGFALVFLISCPVLLILKKDSIAETMAIYAYYFLVITVLTQFRQLKAEDRSDIVE